MNKDRAGILMLILVIVNLGGAFALAKVLPFLGNEMVAMLIAPEAFLIVPAIGMLVCYEHSANSVAKLLHLKSIGLLSAFFIAIITMEFAPVTIALNLLSQFIVTNEATEMMREMVDMPDWMLLLLIGIFAPICEEFVFRGVIYGALRKTMNIRGAIVMQALLFGLMHGNLNQFLYAFVLGILMAILVEATESIAASMLMHIFVNSGNVLMIIMAKQVLNTDDFTSAMGVSMDAARISAVLPKMAIIVVVNLAICYVLIKALAKRNGTWEKLCYIMSSKEKTKESLWSVPMAIAVSAMLVLMLADTIAQIL